MTRNEEQTLVICFVNSKYCFIVITCEIDNTPLSEILLNSFSRISSRPPFRSASAPLIVLYIVYCSASELGIAAVFAGKLRDLIFCEDVTQTKLRNYTFTTSFKLLSQMKTFKCKSFRVTDSCK